MRRERGGRPRAGRVLAALSLVWLAGGCGPPVNREQLAKDVSRADPEFDWTLEKHRTLTNRIGTYERELTLKRSTVEKNIAQLRQDLATTSKNVKRKIAEVKRQLDPERKRIEATLATANEQLRVARFQRASVGRSIAQLRKAEKAAQGTTPDERAAQQTRLEEMLRDAARLDQELAVLKEHARLLKVKLLLIKL